MNKITISNDFSDTPGGRFEKEGAFSGESFRETILLPAYNESTEKLIINFDHCFGFATSFLEEAFGGLVRIHKKRNVLDHIIIESNDDETIPDLIQKYVLAAEKTL